MAIAKRANMGVAIHFMQVLEIAFYGSEEPVFSPIPAELGKYLCCEDSHGYSALTLAWQHADDLVINLFLEQGVKFYGPVGTISFQDFIYENDESRTSHLIRASAKGQFRVVKLILKNIIRLQGSDPQIILQELLSYCDLSGTTALIAAGKSGNTKVIKLLINAAKRVHGQASPKLYAFLQYQDEQGYSALMRAVKSGHVKNINYLLLQLLENFSYVETTDTYLPYLKEILWVSNNAEETIFHLVIEKELFEVLKIIILRICALFDGEISYVTEVLMVPDKGGLSLVDRVFLKETEFQENSAGEVISFEDQAASIERFKIAQELKKYGLKSSIKNPFVGLRSFSINRGRFINLLSIFCSIGRDHRNLHQSVCSFSKNDYQTSFPKNNIGLRKEALSNLLLFLKQIDHASITEVQQIRQGFVSLREQQALQRYSLVVDNYYDCYGEEIVNLLEQRTASSLEEGFAMGYPYLLLDNGKDLLLLNKQHIFSGALLNPSKNLMFVDNLSIERLEEWLATYFGKSYFIHPFEPSIVDSYPDPLEKLTRPVVSDIKFLAGELEGLSRENIQALFLLDNENILPSNFYVKNFFTTYKQRLSFCAERFHKVYFRLSSKEKYSLQKIFKKYTFTIQAYSTSTLLIAEEKKYLSIYGNILINLLQNPEVSVIKIEHLFDVVVASHKEFLDHTYVLSRHEPNQLIDELNEVKQKVGFLGAESTKLLAQFSVFLLPSFIRAISEKDLTELAVPLILMGSDIVLRSLMLDLIRHPQALKMFTNNFGKKLLDLTDELEKNIPIDKIEEITRFLSSPKITVISPDLLRLADTVVKRVPVIGSLLAGYGLIQSGKLLASTKTTDPNRPYYIHLFVNNLATAGLLAADLAMKLPFWPVLGLFSVLVVDQVATEGSYIRKNTLNVNQNFLTNFFTDVKLGLGISTSKSILHVNREELFLAFLIYLETLEKEAISYPLIAMMLPEITNLKVPVRPALSPMKIYLGCFLHNPVQLKEPSLYPSSSPCYRSRLILSEKSNYDFQFGEERVYCAKGNPDYLENLDVKYELLGASWFESISSNVCLDEIPIKTHIVVSNRENIGASVLLNKQSLKNIMPAYTLLVPVDPNYVGNCRINFRIWDRTLRQSNSNNTHSSCPIDLINQCIDKIVVIIAPIYSLNSISSLATEISINDGEAEDVYSRNSGLKEVTYLMVLIDNVIIHSNSVPKKTFVFFDQKNAIKFSMGLMTTIKGFKTSLKGIKNLILAFDQLSFSEGVFFAEQNQTVVISELKGTKNGIIINLNNAVSFSVSLVANIEFQYKTQKIIIQGENSEILLNVHMHIGMNPLFYFTMPFNKFHLDIVHDRGVVLIVKDPLMEPIVIKVSEFAMLQNSTVTWNFSGFTSLNDEIFYSRIVLNKEINSIYECTLEINASNSNATTFDLDFSELKSLNFTKVSILTEQITGFKMTHYYFFWNEVNSTIAGQFISYRLNEDIEDWQLILSHSEKNEESQFFLNENITEIVIGRICYQINFFSSSLLALGTLDNSPIECNNLLAPIKINQWFNETMLTEEDGLYRIANVSFKNPLSRVMFQFPDLIQPIAFSYLNYKLVINNGLGKEDAADYAHYQIASQSVESGVRVDLRNDVSKEKNWRNWISWLLGTSSIVGGLLLGGLFIRRFRGIRSVAETVEAVAGVSAAFLEKQGVNAKNSELLEIKIEKPANIGCNKPSDSQLLLHLFNKLNANIQKQKADNNEQVFSLCDTSFMNLNEQIIWLEYLIVSFKKIFPSFFTPVKSERQFASNDSLFFKKDNKVNPPELVMKEVQSFIK